MSIVSKDIEVLDGFFNEQQEIGAMKERKILMPIMAIMCVGSLLLGAKISASPQEQPPAIPKIEALTLPTAYNFMDPLPDINVDPLELPPTFNRWIIINN